MKKQLLLILFSFIVAIWGFGQAAISCFPSAGDYNTGSLNSSVFTETSLIKTTAGLVEAGYAKFDISNIPAGATIQNVVGNFYIAQDDYTYWNAVAIDSDPLTTAASDLWAEITVGGEFIYYAQHSGSNFPEPDWWIADLGPDAVTDLQENLDNLDGWFAVGIWEYETGGTYYITCDGWNETNQPYIEVTYLLAGAPLPAYNPNPADEALNIEPETDLTWDFGADTETYDLYFGTDFPPTTKVVEDEASGVSGTYDPGTLEFQTTYYWQVVSKNSVAELETPGPVWAFTIKCDVWPVPFYEDLQEVVAPEMPYCWFSYVDSWAPFAVVQSSIWGGVEDSQSMYMNNTEDPVAILIFATPQIDGGVTGKYANFFARGYAPLSIGTMTDPTDAATYTEFTVLTLTGTIQEFEVFFTNYSGTDEYIAFKHEGTDWYQDIFVDNILIDNAPTCPKPSDLHLVFSTISTATVGWTENGSATLWDLEYGYKGFTPTGTPMMSTALNPAEITGLELNTQYEFYVRADCGSGDVSYWVGPFEFATLCEAIDVPILENFELASPPDIPDCWSKTEETTSQFAYINTIDYNSYSAPNCLYIYNSEDMAANLLFVSPPLNEPIGDLWLNFFAWGYTELSIGTISNPADASTYTELTAIALSNTYLNYQEFNVFFNSYSGTDEFIAFKPIYTSGWQDVYIDNIIIDHPPSCPKPEDPYATNQTTNSVTIGWSEMGSATMWNIEYDFSGFTPTGVGNAVADSNPFDLTGLDAATTYEYYVQSDCDGEVSDWVGPVMFKTTCEATSVPYFEGFEDAIMPEPPVCIQVENVNEDTKYWYTSDSYPYEGLQHIRVDYNGSLAMDDWCFSAPLDLIGGETYIVQFFYTCNSGTYVEKLNVHWGEYPSSLAMSEDYIFQDTTISYNYDWHEGIGYFTPDNDGIYYVGWYGFSDENEYYLYVDNITIDIAPTCLKPSDFYASSTTTTSATLQWTENGDATLWNIEYGFTGFTPTGTPIATADSNPYELMNLVPSTVYDVYIQADCGAGDVSWWEGPATFATLCEPFAVTVFENFDNVVAPEIPLCWGDIVESSSTYAFIETISWMNYSAPNSVELYNSDDQFASLLFVSPALTDPINTLWINFFTATDTWGIAEGLIVGTITDPLDASTFTPVDTVYYTVGSVFNEFEVFFTNYSGSDQFIAFKGLFNGTYQYCFIDDIIIDHPPTCPKPSDLYADGATTNSIMLGWQENGDAELWNIEYGDPGFTPLGVPNAFADSNPFELTGLEDGTMYEYYVQSDCGAGDVSYWVGPHVFQTLCFPASLPYEEGFEDVVIPLAPHVSL